ncbi:MAG: hypothetical protein ACLUI7_00250 [Coprococcus sp.]
MRRLKFDNDTRTKVVRLVKWHGLKYDASEVSVRRALNRVGQDIFEDFIKVQHADIEAKNPAVISGKLALLAEKEKTYHKDRGRTVLYRASVSHRWIDLIRPASNRDRCWSSTGQTDRGCHR